MDLGLGNTILAGDLRLVDHIVGEVKSQGIFDQFRKDCIADVDTKPAYQNLRTRVESSVNSFLNKQTWKADLNKNQLRETLRKQIHDAPYLDAGVERIVDQVVNPKVYSVFMPQIEDVVYKFLGIERPKNQQRNGPCGFKDLLPKDLDPVSPESDKNSLRDVSLDSVDANIVNTTATEKEITSIEKNRKDEIENEKEQAKNGQHSNDEEKLLDETSKPLSNLPAGAVFDNLAKFEEKIEEEEEDSPMFEPIDIMNFNESNISNDSHLSGISELTSHRSQSPEFSNETSRDNMDFSNHDSQFSKVSSDSRLSIVTDFGSSNHEVSTPLSDSLKEDFNKDNKNDGKCVKDNFKAVREYEASKINKDGKSSYEISQTTENTPSDLRPIRQSISSKETSHDSMESTTKDSRDFKDKTKDGESSRSKITKDRESKDSKRDKEIRKKSNNHSGDSRNDKVSKTKIKEKSESSRESGEKMREKDMSGSKPKEEKIKETEKKEVNKESKDLKDIYKEKIRELREKKELTEKEKLSKDKDTKLYKETKERRDSSRDKKDSKDHKSSSSSRSHNSSRSDSKTGKSGEKEKDSKGRRSESRDKGKKDERRYSKDYKSKRSSTGSGQTDLGDGKSDGKRLSRSDKDDKNERSDVKQDSKQKSLSKRDSRVDTSSKNSDSKRESSKSEMDTKDKKRRDDKKNKIKDDHSSLRKNSDDRRSTDRDGSNGSNGKSSQKNNSTSGSSSTKPATTNLSKESTTTSNSSSETSDSIEEKQNEKLRISVDEKNSQIDKVDDNSYEDESQVKRLDIGQNEISLPIKKRPLSVESEILLKKPKFAKNFQEAKKLMKIRRRMERDSMKKQLDNEENNESNTHEEIAKPKMIMNEVESVPDDERVQIVEFRDEEYDEPYPEVKSHFTIEERSQIILGGESSFTSNVTANQFKAKSTLSEMEIAIRESLNEMISDKKVEETNETPKNVQNSLDSVIEIKIECDDENSSLSPIGTNELSTDEENSENLRKNSESPSVESKLPPSPAGIGIKTEMDTFCIEDENRTKTVKIAIKVEQDFVESSKNVESVELSDKKLNEEMFDEEEKKIILLNETAISPVVEGKKVETNIDEIASTISMKMGLMIKKETTEMKMNEEIILEKESSYVTKIQSKKRVSLIEDNLDFSDEESPCLYFIKNNERLEKFTKFMKSLEIEESLTDEHLQEITDSEIVSLVSKTMAPPKPKRKYSTSPLTDILLNNTNNNNEAHKIIPSDSEDSANIMKKRKIGRPKKQQRIINASLCSQQNLSNGENFVMPLSPESDVSATSEKIPSNPLKDEKSRLRGSNQRYTSDDLYKPRPLFSSSSRRSRRSNQA